MGADGDAGTDERPCPDPSPILDGDRLCDQVKRGRGIIMIAGAKKGALGNANVAAELALL